MKKMNKKGFTIVELVIVIAVIAILAAVMIPTFSGIIGKANQSAAQQQATAAWKELYAIDLADGVENGYDGAATVPGNLINTKYASHFTGITSFDYDPTAADSIKFEAVINGYTVKLTGSTWSVN